MKECDLHIHSLFSDSDASIEDIFKAARAKNLCWRQPQLSGRPRDGSPPGLAIAYPLSPA